MKKKEREWRRQAKTFRKTERPRKTNKREEQNRKGRTEKQTPSNIKRKIYT